MRTGPKILILGLLLAGSVAAAYLGVRFFFERKTATVRAIDRIHLGGPFALTDHKGKRRTDKDFQGKLLLVFFGYTHCPDVCPTSLQAITTTLDKLGKDADKVGAVFISVDPARDSVKQLAQYQPAFHRSIVMLTGTAQEVAAAARAYRVYYKALKPDADGDYAVVHSSNVYLMDKQGKYLTHFRHGAQPAKMADTIRKHF